MKLAMIGGAAAMLGGGLYVHSDLSGGELYPLPADQVYERLASAGLPPELQSAIDGADGGDVAVDRDPGKAITWRLATNGFPLARFTATLEPAGPTRTRVWVKFQIDPDGALAQQSDSLLQGRFIAKLAETGMVEQIDATLEDRPYDARHVGSSIANYVAANPGDVRDFIAKINAQLEAAALAMDAYGTFGTGGASRPVVGPSGTPTMSAEPMSDARPMVDLSRYNR